MKKKKSEAFKYAVIIAACVVVNILISNYPALCLLTGGFEEAKLSLEDAYVPDKKFSAVYSAENETLELETGTLKFEDIGVPMRNICIEVEDGPTKYMEVSASFTDENFSQKDGFDYTVGTYKIYIGHHAKNYINVSSYGSVGALKLKFGSTTGAPFVISGITVNKVPAFRFSVFRFAVMLLACLAAVSGAWRWKVRKSDCAIFAFGGAMLCVILAAVTIMSVTFTGEKLLEPLPLEDKYTSDQYQQLFSSLHEGRLDINVNVTAAEMEKTGDPYDITMRNQNEPSGDYWDRAYYNGKFYSYFGIAPIFTVYYPVYIMTGMVPSAVLASMIVTIYAIIALTLLYIVLLRRMTDEPPLIPAVLGHLALIFGSSVLALNSEMLFYYIAVISGIGSLAAYLCFLIKAYYESNVRRRCVWLALCGAAAALTAGSRPNMLIYCATAFAAAFYIFTGRDDCAAESGSKPKPAVYVAYICSIGVPVAIGAALLMTYNYKRFGSPFEFGFSYQLTVSNALANNITLAMIPAAIYHYFIEPPELRSEFPFVSIGCGSLSLYPRYTYITSCMGVLSYPVMWALALFAPVFKKRGGFRRTFTLTLVVCAAVLSFVEMCKAGAHYRYTADIILPLLTASLIVLFGAVKLCERSKRLFPTAYVLACLALCATIALGFLLIFSNENSYYMYDYAAVTQMFRSA